MKTNFEIRRVMVAKGATGICTCKTEHLFETIKTKSEGGAILRFAYCPNCKTILIRDFKTYHE